MPQQKDSPATQQKKAAIRKDNSDPQNRCEQIMIHFGTRRVDLTELRALLAPPLKRLSYQDQEQKCFERLVRGYQAIALEELLEVYPVHVRPVSCVNIYDSLAESRSGNNGNILDHLYTSDCLLFGARESGALSHFLESVMLKVTMIDFCMEYAKIAQIAKNAYVTRLCNTLEREQLDHLDEEKKRQYYASFATRHRRVVSSRNYLAGLYLTFGDSVLIDPFITAHSKSGAPAWSSSYPKTHALLLDAVEPHQDDLRKFNVGNRALLFRLLRLLGTRSTYNYVKDFVRRMDSIPSL